MAYSVTGLDDNEMYPANNRMLYTLSSTNTAQPNFRYIADIYINGSPDYNRLEVVGHPTYSSGVVDISGIVQTFLDSHPEDNTTTFKQCGNHVCGFTVQFGEKYGASSGITTYPNITSKSALAFNGVFDEREYLSYDFRSYIVNDSDSNLLTDCPRIEVTTTDKYCVGYLNTTTNSAKYLRIRTFEADGSFQDEVTILNPYNTVSSNGTRSVDIDVSYAWLTTLVTADLATGTAPFIVSNTSYYTVDLLDSTLTQSTETITVYIVEQCSKSTPVRFKFMNNYGHYDYFTFLGASRKITDIKRSNYKSDNYKWSASGYLGNSRYRGNTQHQTVLSDAFTINSDWITEDQSIWLAQLVDSPDVFIYDGSDLVSVNIIDSSYETRYEASQQLFNLTVTYKLSYNRKRQRR